jgi:2-polyprenyl-3-methyl-5-hydroxy-6-metoxy-1,4-benzoquinol methylase
MSTKVKMSKEVCYNCKSSHVFVYHEGTRDDPSRRVLKCRECELVFLDNIPSQESLNEYYKEEYRKKFNSDANKNVAEDPEDNFSNKLPIHQERFKRLKHLFQKNQSVLEIGCGAGAFLNVIKDHVKKCSGVDLNERYVQFMREKLDLTGKVYSQHVEKVQFQEKFDVICLFHVFEHIADPIAFLRHLHELLTESGFLIIEVPHVNDALVSIYESAAFKRNYFNSPHLYYYSEKTLGTIGKKAGFKCEYLPLNEYGLLNHLCWILLGKPITGTRSEGRLFKLPTENVGLPGIDLVQPFFDKINQEYKTYLEKQGCFDTLISIMKRYNK